MQLEGVSFEIILLPDIGKEYVIPGVKIIETGKVLPSHKRDIGIKHAQGEIIAFIDSDAYPPRGWLKEAKKLLDRYDFLPGVCGPGIIPPKTPLLQKAADSIFKMMPFSYRITQKQGRWVDDFPSFNLILRKMDIEAVGGFSCEYLTGEDTLICQKITARDRHILYMPELFVYHSRRPLFVPFLKQIATYGIHRGYFFKKYPKTSRRLVYALPTLGVGICAVFLLLWVLFRLF